MKNISRITSHLELQNPLTATPVSLWNWNKLLHSISDPQTNKADVFITITSNSLFDPKWTLCSFFAFPIQSKNDLVCPQLFRLYLF